MNNKHNLLTQKTVIYRSNYGMPLGRWDSFMNKLWYYSADQGKVWAELLYKLMNTGEKLILNLFKPKYLHIHHLKMKFLGSKNNFTNLKLNKSYWIEVRVVKKFLLFGQKPVVTKPDYVKYKDWSELYEEWEPSYGNKLSI